MNQYDYIDLPIFSLYTSVTYYCPDGLVTKDLEEAKAHGYGESGNRATAFGHGDAFATFDYSVLPVIEGLSLVLEQSCGYYDLDYYSGEERFMSHEVWYTSKDMQDGKLRPLVGTADNPYNYIDQGVDVYLFERDGYVMVLSAMNWESFSDHFTGFRVKAEEFYAAWEKMSVPAPRR